MYVKSVLQFGSLVLHFRNGLSLVQHMRSGTECDEIVLWDGTRIEHPAGRAGLIEAAIEIWLEEDYTKDFYKPADGDVIVDAGANVGLFSIWIARQNPRCRVIALEPFAENFEYLRGNVARARLENVACHDVALGAAFAKGHMQAVGSRSLDHVLQLDSNGGAEISVVPLSGLFELAHSNKIDFLKVDIEGAEHSVFAAASTEMLGRIDKIAMEYHDQIVPGTLDLLRSVLAPTHDVSTHPSTMEGSGILKARRRPQRTTSPIPHD